VTQTLEILYVGTHHRDEVEDIVPRGAVIRDAENVYDAIARLKRTVVGATLVEFDVLSPDPDRAVEALRHAAGDRPILVSMTVDEWETVRSRDLLDQEEVLLRPYYPDELWRRVTRTAMPPPARAVINFHDDADRLGALIHDSQRLNRWTNDLPALADHVVAVVKARLRAERVSLFMKSKKPGELTEIDTAVIDGSVREAAICRLGEGVAGGLAQKKRVVVVQEAGRDGPATEREYKQSSYMIAPLVYES
jgi:hypothetical protein